MFVLGTFPAFCIFPDDVSFEYLQFGEGQGAWGLVSGESLPEYPCHFVDRASSSCLPADMIAWTDAAPVMEGYWNGYRGSPLVDAYVVAAPDWAFRVGLIRGRWKYWWHLKRDNPAVFKEAFEELISERETVEVLPALGVGPTRLLIHRKWGDNGVSWYSEAVKFEDFVLWDGPDECPSSVVSRYTFGFCP